MVMQHVGSGDEVQILGPNQARPKAAARPPVEVDPQSNIMEAGFGLEMIGRARADWGGAAKKPIAAVSVIGAAFVHERLAMVAVPLDVEAKKLHGEVDGKGSGADFGGVKEKDAAGDGDGDVAGDCEGSDADSDNDLEALSSAELQRLAPKAVEPPPPPLPPPALPPPADAEAPRRGFKRGAPLSRYRVKNGGDEIGELVWNQNSCSLDAHCLRHQDCAVNRSVKELARKPQQGRPVGMLMAWLLAGLDEAHPSRATHFVARLGKGEDAAFMTFAKRSDARRLVESGADWHRFLESSGCKERPMRGSEDIEPEGLA